MDELTLMQRIAVWALPVIFAITGHEVAHGWMAKQFGDTTAAEQGRLTLNPLKHIDWLGTIIIPGILLLTFSGFIFGWAKPVPVSIGRLRNPKRSMAWVALAGPLSNGLMALFWVGIARVGVLINIDAISLPLIYSGVAGISINLVLALINLLPIPPLDGSRVLSAFLPDYWAWQFNRLERFGLLILLLLLSTKLLGVILAYPLFYSQQLLMSWAGL